MEQLKEKVQAIFDQFFKEEYLNKLSQFAMKTLVDLVMEEIDKAKIPPPKEEQK